MTSLCGIRWMDKRHRGVCRVGRIQAGKDNWTVAKLSSSPSLWRMHHWNGNSLGFISFTQPPTHPDLILVLPTKTTAQFSHGLNVAVRLLRAVSMFPSHSFIMCVPPQRVTPASAEPRAVVCSQRAWGWRRRQTLRCTPKELAQESSRSPSRAPVSYTANTN